MIYDLIDNVECYSKCCKQLSRAATFIKRIGRSPKDGRYAICGDETLAYRTKDSETSFFEAHRKYIDIQCMLKGEERIDVTEGTDFRIRDRYSKEKDILFIHTPKRYSSIILLPGYFALFYPQDHHRPGQSITLPCNVRKLVIKISVGSYLALVK